jgi:hypothetical protein
MSAHAQLIRLQEIVENFTKKGLVFTKEELDQIDYDAKSCFTRDASNVILGLTKFIREHVDVA